LSILTSLQTLNAGGSDFDDSDVAAISQIKTLTELRLPHCPRITSAALKSIQSMTWLEKLALAGDDVKDSLPLLGSLHLTLLNLAGDKVTNEDVNMLCQKIRTLSTLNLRDNPVGDAVLVAGSPLSTLPALKNLSITQTQISHAAGEKFAASHKSCKVSMPEQGEPRKVGRANS
jgi:Leucine-rich repeat (LRR) protein